MISKSKTKAIVLARLPLLTLWSDASFSGSRLRFRGNIGVRDLGLLNFNDVLSSFEFIGSRFATIVLFRDINFKGTRRIFRGSIDVSTLGSFNDLTSSFIMANRFLTIAEINRIQRRGVASADIAEVVDGTIIMKAGRKK